MNRRFKKIWISAVLILLTANIIYSASVIKYLKEMSIKQSAASYLPADSPFYYFSGYTAIQEADSEQNSDDPHWWLNSGGIFYLAGGVGKTVQGSLPTFSYWRVNYSISNPQDTDNGYHPQNIFRLITKKNWKNFTEEAYFKINKINLSSSPNRNESNGILLMARYSDSNDLYYAGLRVDGAAVIKKKINGNYYTMALEPFYPGVYDINQNPNLLPLSKRIGLKFTVQDSGKGGVLLSLFTDKDGNSIWQKTLEVIDDGKSFGGKIIDQGGAGIRTDFMDTEMDSFRIQENI